MIDKEQTTSKPQRESWSRFAERHGVSPKTLDRWVAAGRMPRPEYINGRKYAHPETKPRQDDEDAA
jgi:predicted site-specific integrase-resolvase